MRSELGYFVCSLISDLNDGAVTLSGDEELDQGPHFIESCYTSNSARMATSMTTAGILLPDWL